MAKASPEPPQGVLAMLRAAFDVWRDADGARLGAAVAFYSTLSLAPFRCSCSARRSRASTSIGNLFCGVQLQLGVRS